MKKPTLEELKKHFENVKIVKDLSDKKEFEINWNNVHLSKFGNWVSDSIDFYYLWSKGKYAEIIEYKQPKFEITKEQILELSKDAHPYVVGQLKKWFPEAFETVLETGNWYIFESGTMALFKGNNVVSYGIHFEYKEWFPKHQWFFDRVLDKKEKIRKATPEEVTEALMNEAKKRGYDKENTFIKSLIFRESILNLSYYGYEQEGYILENTGDLTYNGACVMRNGVWAEIIPSKKMTHQEIEKELGYKIEIV